MRVPDPGVQPEELITFRISANTYRDSLTVAEIDGVRGVRSVRGVPVGDLRRPFNITRMGEHDTPAGAWAEQLRVPVSAVEPVRDQRACAREKIS